MPVIRKGKISMIDGFVSNLTAAALLLHAVLGCCWHHAHTCPHALADPIAATHTDSGSCCCPGGEKGCAARAPADGGQHGGDGCQGARCMFTAAGLIPPPAAPAAQGQGAALAAAVIDVWAADAPCCALFSSTAGCAPPLRIHLLHQVLLL